MDVLSLIFLVTVTVVITAISILYIYERGWRAGLAEGKDFEPYKIITQGWSIKPNGCKGVIKLVDDSEGED